VAKKNHRPSFVEKHGGSDSRPKGGFILFGMVAFVLVAFYLWGKVQVDFVLRGNDRLEQKKRVLQRELNDLRVQVNAMKSYQRITELAKKQGMVFVSANRLAELSVDLDGLDVPINVQEYELQVAGFHMIRVNKRKRTPSNSEKEGGVF